MTDKHLISFSPQGHSLSTMGRRDNMPYEQMTKSLIMAQIGKVILSS